MKTLKSLILSLCILASFTATTTAQVDVTINPLGALFGNLDLGADFMISDNLSAELTVGPNFGSRTLDVLTDDASFKFFGLPVTAYGKYYFNPRNGADKFYADVFLRFVSRNFKAEDTNSNFANYKQTRFGLGFGIGYKVVSDGGFVFDIGTGVGRAFVNNTEYTGDGTQSSVDWPGIMFTGKLGIGYRFGGGK